MVACTTQPTMQHMNYEKIQNAKIQRYENTKEYIDRHENTGNWSHQSISGGLGEGWRDSKTNLKKKSEIRALTYILQSYHIKHVSFFSPRWTNSADYHNQ